MEETRHELNLPASFLWCLSFDPCTSYVGNGDALDKPGTPEYSYLFSHLRGLAGVLAEHPQDLEGLMKVQEAHPFCHPA